MGLAIAGVQVRSGTLNVSSLLQAFHGLHRLKASCSLIDAAFRLLPWLGTDIP
jgi:hypothetical protein